MKKTYLPEQIESQPILLKKHPVSLAAVMYTFVDRDRARLRRFFASKRATFPSTIGYDARTSQAELSR